MATIETAVNRFSLCYSFEGADLRKIFSFNCDCLNCVRTIINHFLKRWPRYMNIMGEEGSLKIFFSVAMYCIL